MKKLTIVLLFYLIGWTAWGQNLAETKLGDWLMYTGNVRLTDDIKVQSVAHLRLYELSSNVNQVVILLSVSQQMNKLLSFGGGYGYIQTEAFDKELAGAKYENRIFEQLMVNHKTGRLKWSHRGQLEHRWITAHTDEVQFTNRARYRLMLTLPVNNPTLESGTFFVCAYSELHLNLTNDLFSQNWSYLALGYQLNKTLSFQTGYQKQFVNGHHHYDRLQFGVCMTLDMR